MYDPVSPFMAGILNLERELYYEWHFGDYIVDAQWNYAVHETHGSFREESSRMPVFLK